MGDYAIIYAIYITVKIYDALTFYPLAWNQTLYVAVNKNVNKMWSLYKCPYFRWYTSIGDISVVSIS